MGVISIRLFGRISVQQDAQPLTGLSGKALELLCYVVLFRDRAHTREALAGLLWPDVSENLSKKYLRQTLWQLRVALRGHADAKQAAEPLLALNPGWVGVNPGASLWLDVAALEQAHADCRDVPAHDLTDPQARAMEAAAVLYRGDLIEAWYQDWCIYERDRLQLTYLAILEKLTSYCEARRLHTKGVAYGQRILRYDPARESTHRQLMRLYCEAGDRTAALRQYERCAAAMAKEFDLRPSRETLALYQKVRGDHLEAAPRRPGDGEPAGEAHGEPLVDLRRRLDHLQASLLAFQDQVQRELNAISRVLRVGQKTPRQTSHETR